MLNMKRLVILVVAFAIFVNTTAYAGVLGNIYNSHSESMKNHTFYKNNFSGGSRGNQSEYYVEYTPNEDIVPVMVNGDSLWGTINIHGANKYVEQNGYRSRMGINADYFSFQTGLQMGYTISGGEIVSKEYEAQDAIGFREDGSAFIDTLQIKTTISNGEDEAEIMFINKWCQPGFDPIYLLTDKFGETTKTKSNCLYVLCDITDGSISVDKKATVTAKEIFEYNGEIKIPDSKILLQIDTAGGREDLMEFMRKIKIGDTLTITNTAINSEKNLWSEAVEATSSVGGRLLNDGNIGSGFEAGVHPRTAAGIKADGNVIFYTLDGRQSGYSSGASLEELAKRMQELGCVDAINFDGGGSTTMGMWLPQNPTFSIVNKPSNGAPRNVANFIFLQDKREKTNIPGNIRFVDLNENVLLNSTQILSVERIFDTSDYEMTGYTLSYSSNDAQVNNNIITFDKSGKAKILAHVNDATLPITFNIYNKIDDITVFDTTSWEKISELSFNPGDSKQIQLRPVAYADEKEIYISGDIIKWDVDGKIGTISETGLFTLNSANKEGKGIIKVTVGNITKEIGVTINKVSAFYDTTGHWANDMIVSLSEDKIFSGIETENGLAFFPDNNMTRAEFAMTISRYMGFDLNKYSSSKTEFTDSNEIPDWAKSAINAVVENGMMNGRGGDDGVSFAPYEHITRAEAMTVLGRTIRDDKKYNYTFTDTNEIPVWAQDEIYKLVYHKIVSGYEDNTIKPQGLITRAEVSSLIYKLLK